MADMGDNTQSGENTDLKVKPKHPAIPQRGSSLISQDESKESIAKLIEENSKKRKLHKSSQESLDCLTDVAWYDEELNISGLESENLDLKLKKRKLEFAGKDLNKPEVMEALCQCVEASTRQKVILEEKMERTRGYRARLEGFLARRFPDLTTQLHLARVQAAKFILSLVNQEFAVGQRRASDQTRFRQDLLQYYDAESPLGCWDPVSGAWHDPAEMVASHLFPQRLGEKCLTQIFGEESTNELWSARNGMILPHYVEAKIDKFMVAIVPFGPIDEKRLKLKVMDKSVYSSVDTQWKVLDGKELHFRNESRPAYRYLYFLYAMCVLRAVRRQDMGWMDGHGKEIWATQGRYIRKSMVIAIGEAIGHTDPMSITEIKEHVQEETNDDETDPNGEERITGVVLAQVMDAGADNFKDDEDDDA